jgi:hypothetical protein
MPRLKRDLSYSPPRTRVGAKITDVRFLKLRRGVFVYNGPSRRCLVWEPRTVALILACNQKKSML